LRHCDDLVKEYQGKGHQYLAENIGRCDDGRKGQDEYQGMLPVFPQEFALYQNYPNPFNPATVIRYEVATAGDVKIRIYNVRGALVTTLYDGHRKPGRYEVVWNGQNRRGEPVSSGVYFYRMETPGFVETRKMVLLR